MEKQILPEIKKPEALEIAIHCLGVQAEQEVCEECPAYGESGIICKEVAIVAISALKEIQQYREIGTVEECREAREKQILKRPVWKEGRSVICKDYADRHGEVEENKWAAWVCPNCGWFVGEQYISRRHNQNKSNYCSRCGQAIQWDENLEEMEDD